MKLLKNIVLFVSLLLVAESLLALNPPKDLYFQRNAPDYTAVALFWTDISGDETGFLGESKVGKENWQIVQEISANVQTTKIDELNPELNYQFRLKAISTTDSSAYCESVRLVGTLSNPKVYQAMSGIQISMDTTIGSLYSNGSNRNYLSC